jgi:uncharacterized membrane protein
MARYYRAPTKTVLNLIDNPIFSQLFIFNTEKTGLLVTLIGNFLLAFTAQYNPSGSH